MSRVKRKLLTSYYWEKIVALGGKMLEMNLVDFPMELKTEFEHPTKYNLSESRRYEKVAQLNMLILCVTTAH